MSTPTISRLYPVVDPNIHTVEKNSSKTLTAGTSPSRSATVDQNNLSDSSSESVDESNINYFFQKFGLDDVFHKFTQEVETQYRAEEFKMQEYTEHARETREKRQHCQLGLSKGGDLSDVFQPDADDNVPLSALPDQKSVQEKIEAFNAILPLALSKAHRGSMTELTISGATTNGQLKKIVEKLEVIKGSYDNETLMNNKVQACLGNIAALITMAKELINMYSRLMLRALESAR